MALQNVAGLLLPGHFFLGSTAKVVPIDAGGVLD